MSAAEILARKFAENRDLLNEAEAAKGRFKAIVDANPVPTVLIAHSGENVYVNQAYATFLKCDPCDLLDFGWRNFIHPDAYEELERVWGTYFFSNAEHFYTTTAFRDSDGQKLSATIIAIRIPDDGFAAFIVPDACSKLMLHLCPVTPG